ncbi:MAG: hypothetical protein QM778_23615 [Myxococcales bacterium]
MGRLVPLSAEIFAEVPPVNRLIVHEHSRRFAKLTLNRTQATLGLSWPSDMIEPVVVEGDGTVWIGVDQRVACVSELGETLFCVALSGFLYEIYCIPEFTAIVCDDQVLTVSRDWSIREMRGLSEIPTGIETVGATVVVTTADGHSNSFK